MEVEVFPNAPIEEAIIAFEVPYLDDLTTSAAYFYEAIARDYPEREEIHSAVISRFTAAEPPSPPRRNVEPNGVRFASADGLQVVAVTREGLSYHRLRPYVNWNQFEAGARPVWKAFANFFGPEVVTELRLRYLNRIRVPSFTFELTNYFRTHPQVPPEVDTGIGEFLMRLRMVDEAVPASANLTMRSDVESATQVYPIVFDVEVSLLGGSSISERELWSNVHALREYKNRLFFNSITDATRAMFR